MPEYSHSGWATCTRLLRWGLWCGVVATAACGDDDGGGALVSGPPTGGNPEASISLADLPYAPRAYVFDVPAHFPQLPQPDSNVATEAGVALGRMLFFDPILSRDSTFACVNCHLPERAFADNTAVSPGIDGLTTSRSSMSLMNVGYQRTFFWDGRSGSLEEQSLHPVEDPIELASAWPEVERRLRRSPDYRAAFRAAFGLASSGEIDRYHAAKALAQFERSLLSGGSKYDRVTFALEGFLSDAEERGRELFFTEPTTQHPGCAHCHNAPLFGDHRFTNNGLVGADDVGDFRDKGRGTVTGNAFDNGKFKAPSLRNVALTAPYMHDGRLPTLDDVLDHYSSGGHYSPTRDPQITGFTLRPRDREDLKAFLATLTDTAAIRKDAYQAPDR